MARISSGSSESAGWAERWGADEAGISRWSELKLFGSTVAWVVVCVRRGRRAKLGVIASEE
jgi:hypothetical protein